MSKHFWMGFREGFSKASLYGLAFLLGGIFVYLIHPYERCERKYDSPNDIMECVWILEND